MGSSDIIGIPDLFGFKKQSSYVDELWERLAAAKLNDRGCKPLPQVINLYFSDNRKLLSSLTIAQIKQSVR
jgi:hypothetical protein